MHQAAPFPLPMRRCGECAKSGVARFFAALFLLLAGAAAVRADELAEAVHAEINLARTAPRKYARIVAHETKTHHLTEGNRAVREAIRFLEKTARLPALKRSTGLRAAARSHVRDQGPVGGVGHLGDDWSTPARRIARFGTWGTRMAENIAYGESDARTIVVRLIVDDGVRDRGHRLNVFGREFRLAGVATGPHARYRTMCVIEFAGTFKDRAEELRERAHPQRKPHLRRH